MLCSRYKMTQGHHNDCAALWRMLALHLPSSKTASSCPVAELGKSPALTADLDSQQRSTKRATSYGNYFFPLLFCAFSLCVCVCFTMECENAIITAVSDGGRQFGRGERGGAVPGMFIECSARRRRWRRRRRRGKQRRERTESGAKKKKG